MFSLTFLAASALSSHTLYFVRHGETIANATGKYSAKTLDTFTPKGESEVSKLTSELERLPRFELVLVSPSPRAMKTIDPYLRRTHQTAVIWPLLYECCTGHRPKDAHATSFKYGAKISVPRGLESEFRLMPSENRFPVANSYDSGLAQVNALVADYHQKFEGKTVLLVGHSGNGGHFLHALAGKWKMLRNAQLEKITVR